MLFLLLHLPKLTPELNEAGVKVHNASLKNDAMYCNMTCIYCSKMHVPKDSYSTWVLSYPPYLLSTFTVYSTKIGFSAPLKKGWMC